MGSSLPTNFKQNKRPRNLLDVEFQIGKIGSITPVAKIEPVTVAYNCQLNFLAMKILFDPKTSDSMIKVLIERVFDVIPYIVRIHPETRTEIQRNWLSTLVSIPCKTPLVRAEEEAAWRCPNYLSSTNRPKIDTSRIQGMQWTSMD